MIKSLTLNQLNQIISRGQELLLKKDPGGLAELMTSKYYMLGIHKNQPPNCLLNILNTILSQPNHLMNSIVKEIYASCS